MTGARGDDRAMMSLEGFSPFSFESGGATRTVYTRGTGPGVVVMHEIPGITPPVARFATRVADEGFRVYLPRCWHAAPSLPYVPRRRRAPA
jgi:dienelactone hydrolase